MDNQDVENGLENFIEFLSTIWGGIEALLDVTPPIVIGLITVVLLIAWAWHAVRH